MMNLMTTSPKTRTTNSHLALLLLCLGSAINSAGAGGTSPDADVIGTFSNMRATTEHQYGYQVQLLRQGNKFFGLFSVAGGLIGDTPYGVIEDLKFDGQTGKLTFSAKMPWRGDCASESGERFTGCSVELYQFRGTWRNDKMTGTLQQSVLRCGRTHNEERIVLSRIKNPVLEISYEEWEEAERKARRSNSGC
jgi:hypothetical protein